MLQLSFSAVLGPDGRTLTLTDRTGLYATGNPGGYGAPNPARADLLLLALAGRQQAGTLRFDTTVYPTPGKPFEFQLPGDGLYSVWILAISKTIPAQLQPGSIWVMPNGQIYYQPTTGVSVALDVRSLDFNQLRDFTPELLLVAETIVSQLVTTSAAAAVDRLLLEYARQGSRNRPQNGQQYAQPWLHAQATLDSIGILHGQYRFPEAAQQLAALSHILQQPYESNILTQPIHTDWVREATTPGRQ